MKIITIKDKEYKYKMTIKAAKDFKSHCGVNVTQLDPNDIEHLQCLIFYGLEGGAVSEGKIFDLKLEDFDNLSIEEFSKIARNINNEVDPK